MNYKKTVRALQQRSCCNGSNVTKRMLQSCRAGDYFSEMKRDCTKTKASGGDEGKLLDKKSRVQSR